MRMPGKPVLCLSPDVVALPESDCGCFFRLRILALLQG